jgi:hypothetical protein
VAIDEKPRSRAMRRIAGSLISILLVLLFAGIVTSTYLAHAEASQRNMPTASRPDVRLVIDESAVYAFQFSNVVPGRSGSSHNRLINGGNQSGQLGVYFSEIINTPGTVGEYADNNADLGAKAEIAIYIDLDMSGSWSSGDIGLKSNGTIYYNPTALDYTAFNRYGSARWDVMTMLASAEVNVIILWRIPTTVGNEIQGDSASFDIAFELRVSDT